jgi:hypothetical protein
MSRQYQNPNYHSGYSQTPYPYPTPSQQSGQVTQPLSNTRDTHSGHSSRHGTLSPVFEMLMANAFFLSVRILS